MTGVLFVTWGGGGNVPPALGIAVELARRGEDVRFLGHAQQRATIEAACCRFEPRCPHAQLPPLAALDPGAQR